MKYSSPSPGNGPVVNFVRMGGKYLPRRLLLDGRGRKGFVTIVEVFLDDSDKVSSAWKIDDVYRWYLVVVACLRMREQRCDKQEVGGWYGSRLAKCRHEIHCTCHVPTDDDDNDVVSSLLLLLLLLSSSSDIPSSGVKEPLIVPSPMPLIVLIPQWSSSIFFSRNDNWK